MVSVQPAVPRESLYGEAAYWQARYDASDASVQNIGHDWYEEYRVEPSSPLRNLLRAYAPVATSPRVVDIGCGDSQLCRQMSLDGYAVIGTDLARSAGAAQEGCSFVHCSAAAMPFARGSFDVAVDKGTMDAMLCAEDSESGRARVLQWLRECLRVVRPGGCLVSVSYSHPGAREPLLREGLGAPDACGRVGTTSDADASDAQPCDVGGSGRAHSGGGGSELAIHAHRIPCAARNSFNGRRFHYVYVCQLPGERRGSRPTPPSAASIGSGADAEREEEGGRLLLRACAARDEACVAALLARGVSAVGTTLDLCGTTPCMVAAGLGAVGCLRALVAAAGVQHLLSARDVLGSTALLHAASAGEPATLAAILLLTPHCTPLPSNAEGGSPLQAAAASGCLRCVEMLLARSGLGKGARGAAGEPDRTGFLPLHAAAFRGHRDVCETLLEWGADARALCSVAQAQGGRRDAQQTSADLAQQAGHVALAAYLRSRRERGRGGR